MASSVVFWTTFLDLFVCPGCGSSTSKQASKLSHMRRQHGRTAAIASVDVIPYFSPSLQTAKSSKTLEGRERLEKLHSFDPRELVVEEERGLVTKDPAVYLGEERKWPVRGDAQAVVSDPRREPPSSPANGAVFSSGGASLWHFGGIKAQGPSLSSRYLRVATYLREQGLVLNRAIHRFVGEQSLAEVQAKFATLTGLGCDAAQAASMVQRCPRLLAQSPSKILAAAEYLRSIGVSDVAKVAASFPEVLGPKSLSYPAAVECLKGWSFSAADIVCIIKSDARVLSMPVPAILDRLLFLVGQLGLDESAVARTVTAFPGLLCYSVDKHLQPRLELLQALGFSTPQIAGLVRQYPRLFSFSLHNKVAPTLQFLLELGLTDAEVVDLVVRKPVLFDWRTSIDTTLRPAAKFLEEIVGSPRTMRRLVLREPRVLLAPAAEQRALCERWLELGFSAEELRKAVVRQPALLVRGSAWNGEAKIEYLRDLGMAPRDIAGLLAENCGMSLDAMKEKVALLCEFGLTQTQVVTILSRFPATFQTSCPSLEDKLRFLTQEMGRSLDELVSYPAFISLSLDKRLRPRWLILEDLGLHWSLTKAFARPHSAFEADIRKVIAKKGAPKTRTRRPGSSPEEKREYLEGLGMDPEKAARLVEGLDHMTLWCIQRKTSTLIALGMTPEQVVSIVERFPRILHSSCNSLEAKIRFLTEDMGRSVDELVGYPSFVSLSLPNRLRPRYARLREVGITWWSLNHAFGRPDAEFDARIERWIEAGRPIRGSPKGHDSVHA